MKNVVWFKEVGKDDIALVGGKGANLGEMTRAGFPIPPGFIVTSHAYFDFIRETGLDKKIYPLLDDLDVEDTAKLEEVSQKIQEMIVSADVPEHIKRDIVEAYQELCRGATGYPKMYIWVTGSYST